MIGSKSYAKLKYREVKGRRMAYIDEGVGDAIAFQHGQPASSYIWRNVMPYLEGMGRLIACDLIGMGESEKLNSSDPNRYNYFAHRDFLFALLGCSRSQATAWCSCWTTGAPYSGLNGPDRIATAGHRSYGSHCGFSELLRSPWTSPRFV
jgi:pimeloyl-ACP methyl ester carboxylesterase